MNTGSLNVAPSAKEQLDAIDWATVSVISFDLDDMLWDNSGVVERAEREVYQFLVKHNPKVAECISLEQMVAYNAEKMTSGLAEFENMTYLRKQVLRWVLTQSNGDLALVNPAFSVFYHWRNQIHVPEKTHQLLQVLAEKHCLYAVSNGNSNLRLQGMNHYFKRHYIGGVDGRAKPHPEMLSSIIQRENIEPHQLLHVGDSAATDVAASIGAGCQYLHIDHRDLTLWFERLTR